MNYEKKYKEALLKAKDMLSYKEIRREDMEYLFPELEESDDEKLRKTTIAFLKEYAEKGYENAVECIDWLEKQGEQKPIKASYTTVVETGNGGVNTVVKRELSTDECYGEQKPTDKVGPKFKSGDWIISHYNSVAFIQSIDEKIYILTSLDGYRNIFSIEYIDENWHLWTIRDAKDGDILSDNGEPFIFKGLDPQHSNSPIAYCGIDCENQFMVSHGEYWWTSYEDVTPATKEECDFLFEEMRKSGYKWDSNKKSLITQNIEKENDKD